MKHWSGYNEYTLIDRKWATVKLDYIASLRLRDQIWGWCKEYDSKGRYYSQAPYAGTNGTQEVFYFEDSEAAVLFSLKWS